MQSGPHAAEARGLINAQVCRAERKIMALIALQRGPGALTVCDSTDAFVLTVKSAAITRLRLNGHVGAAVLRSPVFFCSFSIGISISI